MSNEKEILSNFFIRFDSLESENKQLLSQLELLKKQNELLNKTVTQQTVQLKDFETLISGISNEIDAVQQKLRPKDNSTYQSREEAENSQSHLTLHDTTDDKSSTDLEFFKRIDAELELIQDNKSSTTSEPVAKTIGCSQAELLRESLIQPKTLQSKNVMENLNEELDKILGSNYFEKDSQDDDEFIFEQTCIDCPTRNINIYRDERCRKCFDLEENNSDVVSRKRSRTIENNNDENPPLFDKNVYLYQGKLYVKLNSRYVNKDTQKFSNKKISNNEIIRVHATGDKNPDLNLYTGQGPIHVFSRNLRPLNGRSLFSRTLVERVLGFNEAKQFFFC
jgi:predicted  nucleic acid-binding Zn-ribbon protein